MDQILFAGRAIPSLKDTVTHIFIKSFCFLWMDISKMYIYIRVNYF